VLDVDDVNVLADGFQYGVVRALSEKLPHALA